MNLCLQVKGQKLEVPAMLEPPDVQNDSEDSLFEVIVPDVWC